MLEATLRIKSVGGLALLAKILHEFSRSTEVTHLKSPVRPMVSDVEGFNDIGLFNF